MKLIMYFSTYRSNVGLKYVGIAKSGQATCWNIYLSVAVNFNKKNAKTRKQAEQH